MKGGVDMAKMRLDIHLHEDYVIVYPLLFFN